MRNTVFVTGGTGLIGSHLLYALAKKNVTIKAIKRKTSNIDNVYKIFNYYSDKAGDLINRINWVDGDLRDKYLINHLLKGVNDVYHCAGYISFNSRRKEELFSTNIKGTANIVDASMANNIDKFCYVSSIATLGYDEGSNLIDEKTRWKPDKKSSDYSVSKFRAEMEVWRGYAEGLNTVIVNPSVVLGPGFWNKGVGSFMKKIQNGFNYYTDGSTGYVDVRDVVNLMILLMDTTINGDQYIINSENLTFKEVLQQFTINLGYPDRELKPASKLVAGILWRGELVRSYLMDNEPLITQESAKIAFEKNRYSNKKIKDTFNYNFIPIADTIKHLVEKFLSETGMKISQQVVEEEIAK